MHSPGELIRRARLEAGLTQAQLAERLSRTQATVAALERVDSNPTVATLDRVLRATGHRLELQAPGHRSSVDETLIARNLRLTPAQRLLQFERWRDDIDSMRAHARRSRTRHA